MEKALGITLRSGWRFGVDSPPANCQLHSESQLKTSAMFPLDAACLDCPLWTSLWAIPPTTTLGNSSKGAMLQQQKAQGPCINYLATGSEPLKKLVMQEECRSYHGILSIKIHAVWNRERKQHLHGKRGHVVTFWNCQQPPFITLIQFLILILSMFPWYWGRQRLLHLLPHWQLLSTRGRSKENIKSYPITVLVHTRAALERLGPQCFRNSFVLHPFQFSNVLLLLLVISFFRVESTPDHCLIFPVAVSSLW